MRRAPTALAVAGLAATAVVATPPAASAAPSPNASCAGQTIAPQSRETGPGAVADRIAEIKGFAGVSFGVVISDFARWEDCAG